MKITHDNTLTNKQKDMTQELANRLTEACQQSAYLINDFKLKHEELKSLQLEIDEAIKTQINIQTGAIGRDFNVAESYNYNSAKSDIESNTARIREIILNEL